ncbi:MAG: lipocalin-like domain-containing protein [Bryobacteraceae bacterium]
MIQAFRASVSLAAFAALAPGVADDSYRAARPGYRYSFPRDHFDHPQFRTEWWYYTGNLREASGRRYGFELVFFRQAQRRGPSDNRSAWRIDDMYLAHAALTEIDAQRFHSEKRLNRAGPGIAGASYAERRVWNGNWSARWEGDRQTIEATAEQFRFRLRLETRKAPVIHGVDGISRKAEGEGNASHYVSFTRLAVEGEIEVDRTTRRVEGTAWMDHEWFSHQLAPGQTGWDWMSIQLDSGAELMLFRLRRADGGVDRFSAGTFVDRAGKSRHLAAGDFTLEPKRYWKSAKTQARYPVAWRVGVPSLGLALDIEAAFDAQELVSEHGVGPTYWEGAVRVNGSSTGVGYLEMTGYDKPVKL